MKEGPSSMRFFIANPRLGIRVPDPRMEWEQMTPGQRSQVLAQWEQIRGEIPERIVQIEAVINDKQEQMNVEESFERCCQLNSEIAEMAGTINDLLILYRMNQEMEPYGEDRHD